MRPELIVAGKELRDHVTSRRFLIIFAILLLISVYSIVTGMDQYNKTLDSYKESQQQDWYQQQIADLQKQIQDAQARGDSQELIDNLQAQLDSMINPSMPSVMTIFYSLNQYFVWICILLAIALGFDLITREKEEGSLKSLLSHPVYRDSVINGKTLGAITVLIAAMGAAFLITIAIVLFFGVVPSVDELLRIAGYFLMALISVPGLLRRGHGSVHDCKELQHGCAVHAGHRGDPRGADTVLAPDRILHRRAGAGQWRTDLLC